MTEAALSCNQSNMNVTVQEGFDINCSRAKGASPPTRRVSPRGIFDQKKAGLTVCDARASAGRDTQICAVKGVAAFGIGAGDVSRDCNQRGYDAG